VWCSQTGDHPHEESFYILATLLEPVVEIWRFNIFPFEISCIMAFCLLQNPLQMWELLFQVKKKWKFAARTKWQPGWEITWTEDGGWDCYPCSHSLLELNFAIAPHHVWGVAPRLQCPF
jgi:hypothetical protein